MNWSDQTNSDPLADLLGLKELIVSQPFQMPNRLILSPQAYAAYSRWYYDWTRRIDWDMMFAPRLTRLQRKIKHRIKHRIKRIKWWWQDRHGDY